MVGMLCWILVFFFKQKTAYEMRISDWSSDVCSSDLHADFRRPDRGSLLGADAAARRALFHLSAGEPVARGTVDQSRFLARCAALEAAARAGLAAARRHRRDRPDGRRNSADPHRAWLADLMARSEEHTSELPSLMRT